MAGSEAAQLDFLLDIHLERLIRFHNELRLFMRERHQKAKASGGTWRIGDLEAFYAMHSNNAFLAFHSYVEEMMYQMIKHLLPNEAIGTGSGLKRFKTGLTAVGLNLSASSDWEFFMDASKIRDCLLHANGRISIQNADRQVELRRVLSTYFGELEVDSDRVRVSPAFSHRFVAAIREFRAEYVRAA
jgi:hypothetical protein